MIDCFVSEYIPNSIARSPDYISVIMLGLIVLRGVFSVERLVIFIHTIKLLNFVVLDYAASTQPYNALKIISHWSMTLFTLFCILLIPVFVPFRSDNCHGLYCGCFFARIYTLFGCLMAANALILFCVWLRAHWLIRHVTGNIITPTINLENVNFHELVVQPPVRVNVLAFETLDSLTEICPICLEEGLDCAGSSRFVKLTCGHKLHLSCIKTLVDGNTVNTCPVCRQPMQGKEIHDHHGPQQEFNSEPNLDLEDALTLSVPVNHDRHGNVIGSVVVGTDSSLSDTTGNRGDNNHPPLVIDV